jgi:hypothetical protein
MRDIEIKPAFWLGDTPDEVRLKSDLQEAASKVPITFDAWPADATFEESRPHPLARHGAHFPPPRRAYLARRKGRKKGFR